MRSVLLGLAVVVSAVVLAALQATTPPYAMLTGPILTSGRQSETVSSTTFSVKISSVVKARTLAFQRFGRANDLQSSGVWVVVTAELYAFQNTIPVRAATLIGATGRMYRQSQRAGEAPSVLSAKMLQPGLPTTGIFVFELPEDETQGMQLLLSEQFDPQLKDQIRVSLENDSLVPREKLEIGKDGI